MVAALVAKVLATIAAPSNDVPDDVPVAAPLPTPPATAPSAVSPPRAATMVQPEHDDRESAERLDVLVKQLDTPLSPARELMNGLRGGALASLKTLRSQEPVEAGALLQARRYARETLPQLEAARNLRPAPPLLIRARKGKLKIDGKLDEAAWKRATAIPIQYSNLDKVDYPTATAQLLWDSSYLYAGFTVLDRNIIAPDIARDGPVWSSDCVELFLMPEMRTGKYWEINISPTGSLLDYFSTKHFDQWGEDTRTDATLEGLLIGRTVRGTPNREGDRDEGYTVEVAVPLGQLPNFSRGAIEGKHIYALLGWVNRDDATSTRTVSLAHVPYVAWFHNIWVYQPLVFTK